jgi:DNA-directed RNA polymerase specialized sigma24 family protein
MIKQLESETPAIRENAARQIWDLYVRDLLSLARHRLDRKVRRRVDEDDILQSVYKSFCLRRQHGELDLRDRDHLWHVLVLLTLRKVVNASKTHRAIRRDVGREVTSSGEGPDIPQWALEQITASGPTPADVVAFNEDVQVRLQELSDPELRQIALDKMAGWTNRQIAVRLNYTETTVERKLKRIRAQWTKDL